MSTTWHVPDEQLDAYRSGRLDPARVMSVEAHLNSCGHCRAALPADGTWLTQQWQQLVAAVARPRLTLIERLLRRCGVPEHLARLLAATPTLSRAWLAAVAAVLGFALVFAYASASAVSQPARLLPFLLLAPVLPLVGIALAYGRAVDPAYEMLAATPVAGARLLVVRATAVLSPRWSRRGSPRRCCPVPRCKELTDRRQRHAEVHRVLSAVDLTDRATAKVRKLSGGMRQRLALAQALLADPELLVLDEPTVGLDPEQRMRLRTLLSRLGEHRTVLLSTHQTEDVAALCERVVVMLAGTVRFDGTPAELAAVAAGRVWLADRPPTGARGYWRTAGGRYRVLGEPPPAADLAEPAVQDGYLLLTGEQPAAVVIA